MKSIVTFLLVFLLSNFASAQTKTQNARVKTRGRMIDGEYVPGKGLPGTVVSIKDITDIGVRNSDGTFSFPVDNDNYYVETVTKNEYVLVDSDAAPKMYKYSEDTLYFVMGMPEQMFEDLLEAKDKIRESLEREWKNAMAEIKRLKEENKMSQEEYLEKLEQLMSNQEKNEDLVNEMAKRYSTLDYDQLDVFYRKVNSYIEEGKLTKADSMLRSRGNVSAQIDAQLEKEESIRHREEEIAKAKSVLMHDKKELEQRCYSYFESFKMQHEYDSAAYYIEQRARIDTLNAEWQFGAGVYLYEQKQYSKAEKYLESYLKLSRDLIKSDGSYAVALIVLADLYQNIQRYSDAEQMYEESLEICRKLAKDNPQVYESYVSVALNALAELYIVTQRYSEAEQMYEESLEILRKLAKDNPQVYESYVANALNAFANLYSDTQRYSEAEQMYEESLEILRKLAKDNPQVYESNVAMALNAFANLYSDTQRYSEAEQMYEESLEICRKLAKDNPQVYESYVSVVLYALAELYLVTQRYSDAEQMYEESLEILRKLAKENPQVYESYVAIALNALALYSVTQQRYSDAEQMYEESLEILRKLAKDNPQVYESNVAMALTGLAILYSVTQRYSEAEQMYEESLEILRKLAKDNPQVYESNVAMALNALAILYSDTQRYSEAEQMYEESLDIYRKQSKDNPQVYEPNIVSLYFSLVYLYDITSAYSKSYVLTEEMLPIIKGMYEREPERNKEDYSITIGSHSFCCMFNKEFTKAEQYAREGLEVDPTQTFIYSNLASSLLFQGKYNDAEKIYKQYKTELKDSFLSDFEQFEAEGIIPPEYKSDVEMIKELLND